ncbi:helix-turn-helix domain-containing protein [Salmonella enterica]|uniref:STY4528 family pathogenicity island replication protein n=1 Tax=Salmonella enterica TaxID=28901 RepID=UPI000BE3CC3D|nr:STY4528 family pathogenicity island replication protein [Salmonella enterica]ATI91702.1 helix-turn-helix domain-containing protein [Salmonella enterica subsp. enterica]EBW4555646.1 helix-turn-helix domain-containing protein [Salmonella enterica subsp. enterica serovar Anatum]ECH8183528.1 helix-turn-helix domain-containing protein [Salmonella enterica subsp. enterica serovar Rissen]EDQ4276128.1 helix-turn-helix domain-containing protein [Salmonella enterica subsp. enterica serovar Oranienburg
MAPVNRSTLPADSIIDYTLARMQERLAMRNDAQSGQERSGLLFMGNVHDAYPRALLLDTRLSPLDKVAWMMIRQYALQNDGAIFPSYDELQQLLASPGAGLASRGTVSRALTMLRLTGWLSLCKKVRDGKGRVRGNIYAQHDEPLSARDAETFDPGWLDMVADACRHKSRAVNETAWQVLSSIQDDPMMRHRHSRVTMIAERLTRLSDAVQCARIQSSTKIELSEKDAENQAERLSSNIELSHSGDDKTLSSKRELSGESRDCSRVRKSHHNNVRSFTQSVIKKTYVSPQADKKPLTGGAEGFVWPDGLQDILPENEQPMLAHQLNQLAQKSPSVAEQVAISVVNGWRQKRISNPVGYLLATLKQAREGKYHVEPAAPQQTPARPVVQANSSTEVQIPACPTGPHVPAGQETVKAMVARIRQQLNC